MATGDLIDYIRPTEMSPINGPYPNPLLASNGDVFGVPLPKSDTYGYEFIIRVPINGTPLSTGLTFGVILVDAASDGNPGKVITLGITPKLLVSGTDDDTEADAAGTEQTFNITMPSTAGVVKENDCAIVVANLDSAVAGSYLLIKIRRNGSNASETHGGRVLLLGVSIKDT